MYDCVSYTYNIYPNIKKGILFSLIIQKKGHLVIKCQVKHKDSRLLGCGAALIGKWFHEPRTLEDEGDTYFRNVRSHLPSNAVSHPGRPESFVTLL
jgi:hypothetical protein